MQPSSQARYKAIQDMLNRDNGEESDIAYFKQRLMEPERAPMPEEPISDPFVAQLSRSAAQMGTLGGKAPTTTLPTYLKEMGAEEDAKQKMRSTEEATRRKELLQRYHDAQKRQGEKQKGLIDLEMKEYGNQADLEKLGKTQGFEREMTNKRLSQDQNQFAAKMAFDADMQQRKLDAESEANKMRLQNALEVAKQRTNNSNKMPPSDILKSEIAFERANSDATASLDKLKEISNKDLKGRLRAAASLDDATKEQITMYSSSLGQALAKMAEPGNQTTEGEVARVTKSLGELKLAQTPEKAAKIIENIEQLTNQIANSSRSATTKVYDRYGINYGQKNTDTNSPQDKTVVSEFTVGKTKYIEYSDGSSDAKAIK